MTQELWRDQIPKGWISRSSQLQISTVAPLRSLMDPRTTDRVVTIVRWMEEFTHEGYAQPREAPNCDRVERVTEEVSVIDSDLLSCPRLNR